MRVAISGCGVAGPTLAYWLKRYGFEPVIFEKATAPREGGYIIDFWGPGYEVAERMDLLPALEQDGYHINRLRTVTASGLTTSSVGMDQFVELTGGHYLSIARSDLAKSILHACEPVDVQFGTTIAHVRNGNDAVRLELDDGSSETCDLLIGADGLHSNIRQLEFGRESRYSRPLGFHVAAFTLSGYRPREENTYVMYTRPNRQVSRVSLRGDKTLFLFVFNDNLLGDEENAVTSPGERLRAVYDDAGWEVDQILNRMDEADDVYFDTVSQVQMPKWSTGRTALLGDAAACISLLGGEGTGLAMAEAYVLAGELAKAGGGHEEAFAAYEALMMPLLSKKQENARRFTSFFAPRNWIALLARDVMSILISVPGLGKWMLSRSFTSELELPDYSAHEIA